MIYKADIDDSSLTEPIRYARTFREYQNILDFREREYSKHIKSVNGEPDIFDCRAHLLYTIGESSSVDSTMRLVVDSENGLPDDEQFGRHTQDLRNRGYKLMELGRFHTLKSSQKYLKAYYASVSAIASIEGVDLIVMAMQHRHLSFHERLIGVEIFNPLLDSDFGSGHSYAAVVWELSRTKPEFSDWLRKS